MHSYIKLLRNIDLAGKINNDLAGKDVLNWLEYVIMTSPENETLTSLEKLEILAQMEK